MAPSTYCMMIALASALAAASCARGDAASPAVVALVNGDKITVEHLNGMLGSDTPLSGGDNDHARQKASQTLERLIDRELLVQRAYEAGLDRNPRVVRSLENVKRHILAQAYVERVAQAAPGGTPEEVRAFYHDHPALFEQRRIYTLTELAAALPAGKLQALRDHAVKARSIDEVEQWLRAGGLPFTSATLAKPAERLPIEFLVRLSEMRTGEIEAFPAAGGAWVVQMLGHEAASLSEEAAAPIIARYLTDRIQYAGDFSTTSNAGRPGIAAAPDRSLPQGVKKGIAGLPSP
jgi:EpsD family peptidyl-prolyl cis-trans isomerase